MVVISIASGRSSSLAQLAASIVQASDGTPFTCTVHAPQEESSQPRFEPVSPRSSRKVSSSSFEGSMASSWVRPLTRSEINSFFNPNPFHHGGTEPLRKALFPFLDIAKQKTVFS